MSHKAAVILCLVHIALKDIIYIKRNMQLIFFNVGIEMIKNLRGPITLI